MSEALKTRLVHALLTILLAAGLLLPLLGILHPSFLSPAVLFPMLLTVMFFELACINRVTVLAALVLSVGSLLLWLFGMGGTSAVSDTALAVALRFSGIGTAMPLAASAAVPVITVLLTLVCCFACLKDVSCVPALLLCVGGILVIYLSGSGNLIPLFLPALAALLLMLFTERFREVPLLQILPWVLALVAAAFLLTSGGVPRNPLKEKADELRQAVLDRLFFTEPRDVFSLSSEGYYPEGREQLGGKPAPDEQPVMQVSSPRTVYLRGVIMDQYTGRNWRNTTGGRRYLWQSSRLSSERASLFDQLLPPESVMNAQCAPVTVSVRMLRDSASTLFVPQRVRELTPGGELVPYFSNSSELFVTRNLQAGDTYSVSAPIFQAGDPGLGTLIEICSTFEDPGYDRAVETYTGLPDHLEEPVYRLAREAASAGASPYDRALAIQSWLNRGFRYTLDVEDQPGDVDFVTNFLMNTKKGYCTYFASAMTVLCRMAGLPARYVEGYIAEPDENGECLVTGLSAHAWTEVYFKGFGWVTFDATPRSGGSGSGPGTHSDDPEPSPEATPSPTPTPSPEPDKPVPEGTEDEPTPGPEEPESTPEPTPEPSPEPSPEDSPEPSDSPEAGAVPQSAPDSFFPWLLLLLLAAVAALAARIVLTSPFVRSRRAKTEEDRLEVWIQETFELLYAENMVRRRDESPMAFCRRVDRTGIFSVAVGPVGECLSLIRYSRSQAQDTDTRLVQDSAILLRSELSRPARLRYLVRRIFLPLSRRNYAKTERNP